MSQHEKDYGIVKRFDESEWCIVYIDDEFNQVKVRSCIRCEQDANVVVTRLQGEGNTVIHVIPVSILVGAIYKRREKDKNAKEVCRLRGVIDNAKRLAKEKCNGPLYIALDGEFS